MSAATPATPVQTAPEKKPAYRSLLESMPSKECHCNRCGARIAEGDARCAVCGKKQQVKNTLLLDFLIAHTKDDITGKITDSIYEAVKNFLLSHLFGVVVSLSLVTAVGVTVYASEPYIERVKTSAPPAYSSEYEALIYELDLKAQELGYADAEEMLRAEGEWDTYYELFVNVEIPEASADEDYPYSAEHDEVKAMLQDYTIFAMQDEYTIIDFGDAAISAADAVSSMQYPNRNIFCAFSNAPLVEGSHDFHYEKTRFTEAEFTESLTHLLAAQGLFAGETVVNVRTYDPDTDETLRDAAYIFTVVRGEDGTWYVAGSRQLEEGSTLTASAPSAEYPAIYETLDYYYFFILQNFDSQLQAMRLTDFAGEHQMARSNLLVRLSNGENYYPENYFIQSTVFEREQMESDTSRRLADEGYTVAECTMVFAYDVPALVLEKETDTPETCYRLTLVKTDGDWTWQVAEDVLLYAVP